MDTDEAKAFRMAREIVEQRKAEDVLAAEREERRALSVSRAIDASVIGACVAVGVAVGCFAPRSMAIGFGLGNLAVAAWYIIKEMRR